LTNQNKASGLYPAAVAGFHGFGTSHDAAFVEILPQERNRMTPKR
jgi:hypothetical protein